MDAARSGRRPGRWRSARWVLLAAALGVPAGYAAISLAVADILTRPNNRATRTLADDLGPGTVAWSTATADGLTLRGWYAPTEERRRLVVLVHGMGGSRDEMAALGRDIRAAGFDVLVFDLRGHGGSDPSRLFMGRRERGDIRAVLGWATANGYTPDRIGWLGYSMGASTVLMEAAQNGQIRAAVLDSPFGNLPELLRAELTRHSHLPSFFNPGILAAARLAYGVRTDDLVPLRSARTWGDRPLLLIHGEADDVVPVRQARELARVLGPTCRAFTLPGVRHVGAYRAYPERYVAAVDRFFEQSLRP